MTTGATIRACAAALEGANHQVLGALTLALA
jgi:predicted amidophosphoribosyltransferase